MQRNDRRVNFSAWPVMMVKMNRNHIATRTFTWALLLPALFLGILPAGCENDRPLSQSNYLTGIESLKQGKLIQVSSYDTTGGNNDRINIPAGQTAVIFDQQGPGVIARIWITIDSRDRYFLRRMLLRFYWDEETEPSAEVPVGDFFGCGFEYRQHASALSGMTSGGYYCYFPMPFDQRGRIEVVNETVAEVYALYYQVEYYLRDMRLPDGTPYFHAQWNRQIRTNNDSNYTILKAEGKGFFAGVSMNMQAYNGSLWFLEGDEMVYVDGEKEPSIRGTGTEDYFNSGWYFKQGEFDTPFHGLVLKDEEAGRVTAYRYHIPDPIPFKKSILFTIEHGHGNESMADYSSTAYWYQTEPHLTLPGILPSNARIPLRLLIPGGCTEAEELQTDPAGIGQLTGMLDYGPEWSGGMQLVIDQSAHPVFDLIIPGLREAAYQMTIYYSKGTEYGSTDVYAGEQRLGTINGFSGEFVPSALLLPGEIRPVNGVIRLTFRESGGKLLGLDAIRLIPVRKYIPSWQVIGPFPNRRESDLLRFGLDSIFAPEKVTDLRASCTGTDGKVLRWKEFDTPPGGYFSLWDKIDPYEFAVTYALVYVYSPVEQVVPFLFGSDDGIKVFLNHSELFRYLGVRIASADQDEIGLPLKQGWNELLLKIENNFGGYAFYARIIDQLGTIKYGSQPPGH